MSLHSPYEMITHHARCPYIGSDRNQPAYPVTVRIDTAIEWDYYRHGGILPMVLRRLAGV